MTTANLGNAILRAANIIKANARNTKENKYKPDIVRNVYVYATDTAMHVVAMDEFVCSSQTINSTNLQSNCHLMLSYKEAREVGKLLAASEDETLITRNIFSICKDYCKKGLPEQVMDWIDKFAGWKPMAGSVPVAGVNLPVKSMALIFGLLADVRDEYDGEGYTTQFNYCNCKGNPKLAYRFELHACGFMAKLWTRCHNTRDIE